MKTDASGVAALLSAPGGGERESARARRRTAAQATRARGASGAFERWAASRATRRLAVSDMGERVRVRVRCARARF